MFHTQLKEQSLTIMRWKMAATAEKAKEELSNPDEDSSTICLPDRDAKIAEIAYRKAENRGFEPGHELEDWLEAEQEFLL
ncbi:Protein of unknown function (DUF2934) [Methylobacter tundripaludum]|uniref:DUF2934 family protein n=2 Tax=Methylobacter tundripaludum TaxID=173365 RepID=A0A2S6HF04_9GAMM|nr:Protein of unknown function (DUF2934) [Methylobacter tundripaludum]